jgi:rRNA-processing protein FCF1
MDADPGERGHAIADLNLELGWDEGRHEKLHQFLQYASRRLVTAHVIVEALRLRNHSYLRRREREFRVLAVRKLIELEEVSVPLKDLDTGLLIEFGPTDAGLISVAQSEGAVLLTNDKRLGQRASDPCVEIMMLDQL